MPKDCRTAAQSVSGDVLCEQPRWINSRAAPASTLKCNVVNRCCLLVGLCLLACRPSYGEDLSLAPIQMDELVINGERSGPGLWHIHHGTSDLWLLGSMTPLLKGITWRSKQVEKVLDAANHVVVQKPLQISAAKALWLFVAHHDLLVNAAGKRLSQVMPAALYQRFDAARAKYTEHDKWERYRPIIASAFLQREAFHSVGLSAHIDLGASMRTLAEKHHVPVEELEIAGVRDFIDALKALAPETENACVEASLATVQTGLPLMVERAQAWAAGDVERIQRLHAPPEVDACRAALDAGSQKEDLVALVKRAWMRNLESHLKAAGVTVAVIETDLLLEKNGIFEQLRAAGYTIEAL